MKLGFGSASAGTMTVSSDRVLTLGQQMPELVIDISTVTDIKDINNPIIVIN
ncbi:MAG: hypothetical protein WA974_03650 [Thermodesulfobacteriota bacterium]